MASPAGSTRTRSITANTATTSIDPEENVHARLLLLHHRPAKAAIDRHGRARRRERGAAFRLLHGQGHHGFDTDGLPPASPDYDQRHRSHDRALRRIEPRGP